MTKIGLRASVLCLVLTATGGVLCPNVAFAQAAEQDGEFTVQRFDPAPGPHNYLSVESARTRGELAWSAGMMFDYARDVFVLRSCVSSTNCDDPNAVQQDDVHVVQDMFTWNALASLTPIPRLQLGLRIPVIFVTGDGLDLATGGPSPDGLSAVGMGDPALEGKVRIFGDPGDLFVFGAALDIKAPMGHVTAENSFIGNSSPVVVGLRGIADFKIGPATFAANLKGIYRKDGTVGATSLGPEFQYGVGAGVSVGPGFRIIAETFGGTRFTGEAGTNALEVDGGLQYHVPDTGLVLTIGGGAGVLQGIGVPLARAIAGVSWVAEGADGDSDGIPDDDDECPTKPEDKDGIQDSDGCPEEDVDHDKLPDDIDKCPLEPETVNQYKDDDGCPDSMTDTDNDGIPDEDDKCPKKPGTLKYGTHRGCPDSDKDGVADAVDKCPKEQEDTDGFADTDGCPDPDNDGDGVLDAMDECADQPEIHNGFKDSDGCPDFPPDRDGDGIPDDKDRCPSQAENLNDMSDDDGCPEFSPALVEVSAKAITLKKDVKFSGPGLDSSSHKILNALAAGLKNHGEIFLVEVTVTATKANAANAPKRAKAVVGYLKSKGVAERRLKAKGTTGAKDSVSFKVLKVAKKK